MKLPFKIVWRDSEEERREAQQEERLSRLESRLKMLEHGTSLSRPIRSSIFKSYKHPIAAAAVLLYVLADELKLNISQLINQASRIATDDDTYYRREVTREGEAGGSSQDR